MTDEDDDTNDDQGDLPSEPLEEVFSSLEPTEVNMARDFLETGGIETFIFDGAGSRMLGTTVAVMARLMVHEKDADEARLLLKDMGFNR
ncbi:MAG TPA: DUF2007 domain-containing protein [Candidatus Binataceae bacterium]